MPVCGFPSASSSNPRHQERGAGRGQEARMIHAPGPLPGRPLAFLKKRVFRRGKKKLAEVTPSGSSASLFGRSDAKPPPSQSCRCLTSDVSKIPNAWVGLHPRPPAAPERDKSRFGAREQRPVTHAPPSKARGPGRGSPAPQTPLSPVPNPGAQLRGTPTAPPHRLPRRSVRRSPGRFRKEGCVPGAKRVAGSPR